MPKVFIWRDGAVETEFDPGHRDWRIGRSETNDITLIDPRKSVSRFHAELREEHGRWVFIDLNSQNGSWKDGQRVNRLTLEHGHEVLFGDYKLAFHDVKPPAAPPPPVRAPETSGSTGARTNPPPPDQTLLMPGAKSSGAAVASGPPAPVKRAAVKDKPPRKGVNPVILVLFLLTMLGAVAAVAYRLVAGGDEAVPVSENTPTPVAEAPPPIVQDVTPPPSGTPSPAPDAPASTSVTPGSTAPAASLPGGPMPAPPGPVTPPPAASTPKSEVTPPATRPTPGPTTTRPKRPPPPAPKDAPAVVSRYEEGRRALNAGRFVEAERAFQAVLAQQPGFRDTPALLIQARQGQTVARERQLADAQALETAGDWSRAIAAYERAGAGDQAAAARTKMHAAGDDAYRKARQFDARNRPTEAVMWYGRAVEWLADADARKATARDRLAALKGGEE
jgi:hypothetical protein